MVNELTFQDVRIKILKRNIKLYVNKSLYAQLKEKVITFLSKTAILLQIANGQTFKEKRKKYLWNKIAHNESAIFFYLDGVLSFPPLSPV